MGGMLIWGLWLSSAPLPASCMSSDHACFVFECRHGCPPRGTRAAAPGSPRGPPGPPWGAAAPPRRVSTPGSPERPSGLWPPHPNPDGPRP